MRQGDSMSPLIFVLCMNYPTKILTYIGDMNEFKYFIAYASTKVNHLYFADYLLLFYKGEVKYAYLLLQGIKLLTTLSGLQANNNKSTIYYTTIEEEEVLRIT